ncbi:MAG: tetratricopeptide repeat protein [Leptospirillia bacterium]
MKTLLATWVTGLIVLLAALPTARAETPQADADARFDAGVAALSEHRYDDAAAAFREVAAQFPFRAPVLYNLGVSYLGAERRDEAFAAFQILRTLYPENPAVHLNLARIYREMGHARQERDALIAAIRLKPDYTTAHRRLAHSFLREGSYYAATAEYGWLIEHADHAGIPPQPSELYYLAILEERLGEKKAARSLYQRLLAMDPQGEHADDARKTLDRLTSEMVEP